MGLLNKFKNMFTEEIEEEPIKKETIQVEIPAPTKIEKEEPRINKTELPEIKKEEPVVEKKEDKFNFPVFFDDKDFDVLDKPEPPEPKDTKIKPYQGGSIEIPKEKPKTFKPTPIISPIYGVLDKNYKKEDITTKSDSDVGYYKKDISVDDIRNKAYGTLEDDLETSLIHDSLYDEPAVYRDEKEMFDNLDILTEDDYFTDLIPEPVQTEEVSEPLTREAKRKMNEEDNMVAEELGAIEEESKEDVDLFELIDSMYKKGDE